jgi:hypothetical protein
MTDTKSRAVSYAKIWRGIWSRPSGREAAGLTDFFQHRDFSITDWEIFIKVVSSPKGQSLIGQCNRCDFGGLGSQARNGASSHSSF